MFPLDNEITVIFPYTLCKEDERFGSGEFCFNENFLDISNGETFLMRIPFEYIQMVYKAMCDKRFDIKTDET